MLCLFSKPSNPFPSPKNIQPLAWSTRLFMVCLRSTAPCACLTLFVYFSSLPLLQPPCSSNCCSSNTKTTHRRAFALAVPSAWDAPPREQGSLSPFIHISAPMPPHCRDFSDQLLNMPFSLSILFPA